MKKILVPLIALAIATSSFATQEPPALGTNERELITNIYRVLSEIPVLTNANTLSTTEIDRYTDNKKYFERDYTEILKINPNIDSATYLIRGLPVNKTLADGKELIANNNRILSARPNSKALALFNVAKWAADNGVRMLADPSSVDSASIENAYQTFISKKAQAMTIDPTIAEYFKKEIGGYEKSLIAPYEIYKRQQAETLKQKLLQEEANQRVSQKIEKEKQQELITSKARLRQQENTFAKKFGFSEVADGMTSFIEDLIEGQIDSALVKKILVFPDVFDDEFIVQSIESKYVIFARNSKNLDTQQFALLREKGRTYLNGSKLPDGTYGYLGVEEFITVLGVRKQIPVFKQYPVF